MTLHLFNYDNPFNRIIANARFSRHTRKINRDVERAFTLEPALFPKKARIYTGFFFTAAVIYALVNIVVTKETTANIPPQYEASVIAPVILVAPAPVAEPAEVMEKLKANETELENREPAPVANVESIPGEDNDRAIVASLVPDLEKLPTLNFTPAFPEPEGAFMMVVDKSREELLILKDIGDKYQIVERFNVSLGSKNGDKFRTGDKRTPEGVYHIVKIKEDHELPARYGPRAFVLNYPNEVDVKLGKTGNGIWIHGSGLGKDTKPTQGCVEVNDWNIMDLGAYADVGSTIYIFPDKFQVPIRDDTILKSLLHPKTIYGIKKWYDRVMASQTSKEDARSTGRASGS